MWQPIRKAVGAMRKSNIPRARTGTYGCCQDRGWEKEGMTEGIFFLNVKNSNDGMFRSHSPAGTTANSLQPEWDGPSQRRRRPVSVPEGGRKVPTVQEGGESEGRGWVTTLILSYHDGTGKLYINNILELLSRSNVRIKSECKHRETTSLNYWGFKSTFSKEWHWHEWHRGVESSSHLWYSRWRRQVTDYKQTVWTNV